MAIYDTYAALITEQIIFELLRAGTPPSVSAIASQFKSFTTANDISKPLFDAETYHASEGEASSVAKYNDANSDIQRDFKVLYRHLTKVSDQSLSRFERWRAESSVLEGRLEDLEQRINSLLLLSNDTAGYFNFIQENFVDMTKVDTANTNAYVNIAQRNVSIGTSTAGTTRVDLIDLKNKDVVFTSLTKDGNVDKKTAALSDTKNIVSDARNYWQEYISMDKQGPVSAEVVVDMKEKYDISRIDVDLHMANQNSTVDLTILYSNDNYSWQQLPISNTTRSIVDKSTFQFSSITAQYIKLIMTKRGYDQVKDELYYYEFGIDELSFYSEERTVDTDVTFTSQPLSVNDINGNPEQFSRIVLEVCEDVPDKTSLSYSIAVSNDSDMPAAGWVAIDPLTRTTATAPTLLDFGDLDSITISGIQVSYNASVGSGIHANPSQSFTLIEGTSGTSPITSAGIASQSRYSFENSNERILNYQVASGVQIAQGSLELWRNVSVKGNESKVRGYVNGWGFEEPYYKTTVYVSNSAGYQVDFGAKSILVDGTPEKGKITISSGRHVIHIHKDNWKAIDSTTITDLASLKTADTLYPYNQRYLVEGFNYPSGWSDTEEKVYSGFDIVAEFFMREISPFDMSNNVLVDDYSKYARDNDAADTGRTLDGSITDTTATTVFLLKVKESSPDFVNEQFMLRFKGANSLYTYLRLRAVFSTEDLELTPYLDSFRIKMSS